jgi:hypothetical protein
MSAPHEKSASKLGDGCQDWGIPLLPLPTRYPGIKDLQTNPGKSQLLKDLLPWRPNFFFDLTLFLPSP